MIKLVSVVALLGSGITVGVLLCVAFSLVPGFLALPPGQYVEAHKLFGRYFDRIMPPVVVLTTALMVVLALQREPLLYGLAAGSLACVSVVSQTRNVPINRRVKRIDGDAMPADWVDPRRDWRRWHLLRTGASLLAFVFAASAAVSP